MIEKPNGSANTEFNIRPVSPWIAGPKDFIFKYLPYLPLVLTSIVLLLAFGYIKVRYTTQIFKVQASMLIQNDASSSAGSGSGSADQRFQELFMTQDALNLSNEIEVLKSTPVLQRVARDLNQQTLYYSKGNVRSSMMYPNSPFTLRLLNKGDSSRGFSIKVSLVGKDGFLLNEGKTPLHFGETIKLGDATFQLIKNTDISIHSFASEVFEINWFPLRQAAANLQGGLRVVQTNEQSTILTLSFEGENPFLGEEVLNTLMAVYDTLVIEDKNRIAANTLRFINDRLYELSDTIKGVQGVLTNFMVQNKVFDIENQSKAYLDKMGENAKVKAEQEVKISIANYLLTYISDKKYIHELVPTDLGIEEPALLQLVTEYNRLQLERDKNVKTSSPSNPLIVGMDQSLDKIRQNIHQALSNVKQAYMIASESLGRDEQQAQTRFTSLPGKSLSLLNIERRQKILEDLYSLLLQKRLEISLSSASTISNSKVVEPATASGTPVSPDKKKVYTLYFLVGILLPAGFVVIRELLRDKVSGKADVEKYTTAPILGEIGHSEGKQTLVVTHNSRRLISEQFRIIRTNLQYLMPKTEKQVILVTSSFSGEGKSFISTNMGAVMALSGKRTVIMEFDIRKPKIVSGLDLKRKMGITNYIIGKASFEELLIKVNGIEELYVIPCGPIPPNPSEILLDKRLDELMQEVLANFDVVIMDTAPIGLVSDAINLNRFSNCTLYITRQGYTFRKQLGLVEDLYVNKKLAKLSVLINDVKVESGYYGGGYGYYGGYGYGKQSSYFDDSADDGNSSIVSRLKHWIVRRFK